MKIYNGKNLTFSQEMVTLTDFLIGLMHNTSINAKYSSTCTQNLLPMGVNLKLPSPAFLHCFIAFMELKFIGLEELQAWDVKEIFHTKSINVKKNLFHGT